jgi:dihydrofolate reductase
MKAIVVVDNNWGIGKGDQLLVHLPGDLKYFKEKTLGKTIIVGRKTLESFPGGKPLPGRKNIVLTTNREFEMDNCSVSNDLDDLFHQIATLDGEEIFVVGGACIYEMFLPYCDDVYVTRIQETYDADKYFPNLDQSDSFVKTWQSDMIEEKGVQYRFEKYSRK